MKRSRWPGTRGYLAAGGLSLLGLALIAGCGGSDDSGPATPTAVASTVAAPATRLPGPRLLEVSVQSTAESRLLQIDRSAAVFEEVQRRGEQPRRASCSAASMADFGPALAASERSISSNFALDKASAQALLGGETQAAARMTLHGQGQGAVSQDDRDLYDRLIRAVMKACQP